MEEEIIEVNTYILEDNIKYIELDRLKYKDNEYILLYEDNKIENLTIRKISNNELLYLEEKEFYDVTNQFKEKNMNLFK